MTIEAGDTILNKYHIIKQIGQGGVATVWLAKEPAFGNRQVALKELRADLLDIDRADAERRFQREVEICAAMEAMDAPNVVRTHTVEPFEGSLLLVMSYMFGGDLADRIRQNRQGMPVEEALAIARSVLEALHAAHEHPLEIVHRDIKPSNILFDGESRAYMADFGVAQVGRDSNRTRLQGQPHPGSPPWMAPEQERSVGYLTPAADIYALGCVLFEMLTGKRYKRVRPGTAAGSLRESIPEWLDTVLSRALAEDPYDRYAEAGEMLEALRAGDANRAVAAAVPEADMPAPPPPAQEPAVAPAEQKETFQAHVEVEPAGQAVVEPDAGKSNMTDPITSMDEVPLGGDISDELLKIIVCPEDNGSLELVEDGKFLLNPRNGYKYPIRNGIPVMLVDEGMKYQDKSLIRGIGQEEGVNKAAPAVITPRTKIEFDWVTIPAGEFLMGSDKGRDSIAWVDEQPQHRVHLPEYHIARVPVTVAQFRAFMSETGYRTTAEEKGSAWAYTGSKWEEIEGAGWQHPRGPTSDVSRKAEHPVTCVSWLDAVAFCKWAGVRLPSEAEWEKAARGTDGRIWPWGNEEPDEERCNFGMNIGDTTTAGRYKRGASPYGVLDMAGNMWEWTNSQFKDYPYWSEDGREAEKAGASRVVRGGSFGDPWNVVRCAARFGGNPDDRDFNYGFRVVSPGF